MSVNNYGNFHSSGVDPNELLNQAQIDLNRGKVNINAETMYVGELTPDMSDTVSQINSLDGTNYSYDNYVQSLTNFRNMSNMDKLQLLANLGKTDYIEGASEYFANPVPFEKLSAEDAGITLGLEAGSEEHKNYVAWYSKMKSLGDDQFVQVKQDFYNKVQSKKHAINNAILTSAKDPTAFLKLQQTVAGLDKWYYRYPAILYQDTMGTIIRGGKGAVQFGLTAAYQVNDLAERIQYFGHNITGGFIGMPDPRNRYYVTEALKAVGKFEPQLAPIVKEGFVDNQIGAIGNVLGQMAVAASGGWVMNGAMSLGLATDSIYSATKDMSMADRTNLAMSLGVANAALNYLGLDRYMNTFKFDGPIKSYLARAATSAISEGVEETLQQITEDMAAIENEVATGKPRRSLDWAQIFTAGGYGISTSLILSSFGAPGAYNRHRQNSLLMRTVNDAIEPVAEIINNTEIDDTEKSQAIRDILGEYGRSQTRIDAEALVALGDKAVKLVAEKSGVPESTFREAAELGQFVRIDLASGIDASVRWLISEDIGPDGNYGTTSGVIETLSNTGLTNEDKINKLLAIRERMQLKRSVGSETILPIASQQDLYEIDDIIQTVNRIDETDLIREKVENGTATEAEKERWQRYLIDNAVNSEPAVVAQNIPEDSPIIEDETELAEVNEIFEAGSLLKQLEDGLTDPNSLTPQQQESVKKFARSPDMMRTYLRALTSAINEINTAKGEVALDSNSVDLTQEEIEEAIEGIDENESTDWAQERLGAIEYARRQKAQRIGIDLAAVEQVLPKRPRGRPAKNTRTGDVVYDSEGNPVTPVETSITQMRMRPYIDQGADVSVNRNMMTITWPDGRVERQQIVPTGRPTVDKEARDAERRAERARRAEARELKRKAKQAQREAEQTSRAEKRKEKSQIIQNKAELARIKAIARLMTQQSKELAKTQRKVTTLANKSVRIINLEAQQEAKTKIKAFVNKGKKPTIHGLFRANPDSATINEIKLTAQQIKDLLFDGLRTEEISMLDNLDSIKRLRIRLTEAFQGDQKAVSANMQLLKSMIVTMGHRAGLTPAQYASSFYVDVALKSRVIGRYIDSVGAMTEQINKTKQKDARAQAKSFISTDSNIDNQYAVDRLSTQADEANGMLTPDGKVVSFLWGADDNFFLRKIRAEHGQDLVNAIPEIITKGNMTEKTNNKSGVTTRVYTTPDGKLSLTSYNGNFIITDYTKTKSNESGVDATAEKVAHLMANSNLQGEYRNALRAFLTSLVNQGEDISNISGYENLVKRAIDTSNAFSERANQIIQVTENVTKAIDPNFLKILGVDLPGEFDFEKAVKAVTDFIKTLRDKAETFKYFYTSPSIVQALGNIVEKSQLMETQNTNSDGLTYAQWLAKNNNGDLIPVLLREKRINKGDEKQPLSSIENFSKPYNRDTFTSNLNKYFEGVGLSKNFLESTDIARYISALAEYSGFIFNVDPRIFADIKLKISNKLGKTIGGRYLPNDNAIEINSSRVLASNRDFESTETDFEASQQLGSVIVHEFFHQLEYTVLKTSDSLAKVDVGPFYKNLLELSGVNINQDNVSDSILLRGEQSLFTPLVDGQGVSAHSKYLSKPGEQFSFLGGLLFGQEVRPSPVYPIETAYSNINDLGKAIFSSPQIRQDLANIQSLFGAVTQQELMTLLNSNTKYQQELANVSKLAPRSYFVNLIGGKFNYASPPHEFIHIFLDLIRTDNPELWDELDRHLGGKLSQGDIEAEEALARQFEVYILEGKAPSLYLRKTFGQYSEWLSNIYDEKFRENNAVDPALRQMFNKFFAADEQIRLRESLAGIEESFLNTLSDDNPKKAAVNIVEERRRMSAREAERHRLIGNYFKLSGEDKRLRESVSAEINNDPFNVFIQETGATKVVKLRSLYSSKTIDPSKLIYKGQEGEFLSMIANWNAQHPDQEFASVEQALQAMKIKGTISSQISSEFNKQKNARLANILDQYDGIDFMTDEAIFSKDLTVYLDKLQEAVNLEKVSKANGLLENILIADARTKAEEDLGNMNLAQAQDYRQFIGDMKKNLIAYRDSMNRGDIVSGSRFLSRARVAQHKIHEAIRLRDRLKSVRKEWTSNVGSRLGKMNLDYANNIVAILNKYGINNLVSQMRVQPLQTLELPQFSEASKGFQDLLMNLGDVIPKWIQRLEAPPEFDGTLETLTVRQFNEISDTLKILEKSGVISLKALKQVQYKDAKALLSDMNARLDSIKISRPGDYNKDRTRWGRLRRFADRAGTYGLLNEFIFSKADGFTDISGKGYGPHRTLFFAAREAVAAAEALQEVYQNKMKVYTKEFKNSFTKRFKNMDKTVFGPISEQLTLQHGLTEWDPESLLMIALNTGNTGNMQALTTGYKMSTAQIQTIMNQFNSKELAAIQGIWNVISELYKPASEVYYNIKGIRPKRVDAVKQTYAHGTLEGGYFPLVTETTDGRGSEFFKTLFPSMEQSPSFMKERAEDAMHNPVNRKPPRLDVSVIANHVYTATRLIATGETMDMIAKIVHDAEWSAKFIRKFGRLRYNDVLQHFGMMANPHSIYDQNSSWGGKIIDWARGNAVTAALGFRFISGLKQRTDILQTLNIMVQQNRAPWWKTTKTLLKSIYSMGIKGNIGLYSPARYDEHGNIRVNGRIVPESSLDILQLVYLKSDYAMSRDRRMDMNLSYLTKDAVGQETTIPFFGKEVSTSSIRDTFFTFIKYNDRTVFGAAWYTQYQLSKDGFGTFDINGKSEVEIEKLSIRDADAIAATMSSNAIPDLISAQRDPMMRLFSTFISAQIRKTSRTWQSVQAWKAGKISLAHLTGNLAVEYYGRVVLGLLASQLVNSIAGDDDEEDKKSGIGHIAMGLLTEPLWGTLETVPLGSSLSSWGRGYSKSVLSTPTQSVLDIAVGDMKRAYKGMVEGNMWDAIKYTAYAGGYFTRIPIRNPHRDLAKVYAALGFDKENNRGRK